MKSNASAEIESTWKERPKFTLPAHMLTCHITCVASLNYVSVTQDKPGVSKTRTRGRGRGRGRRRGRGRGRGLFFFNNVFFFSLVFF